LLSFRDMVGGRERRGGRAIGRNRVHEGKKGKINLRDFKDVALKRLLLEMHENRPSGEGRRENQVPIGVLGALPGRKEQGVCVSLPEKGNPARKFQEQAARERGRGGGKSCG